MEDRDKTEVQPAKESPERPRWAADVDRGYRAISRIVSVLNTDLPMEDIVLGIGSTLHDLIPYDRLSLGLVSLNRWYYLQDGDVTSREFFATAIPMAEEYSATRWVILNQQPLVVQENNNELFLFLSI